MKPDPTTSISSTNRATATSLSYQAIALGQRTANETKSKAVSTMAIKDLVETSDREPDAASQWASRTPSNPPQPFDPPAESGGLLDLTG